jgi:hypothetical protein
VSIPEEIIPDPVEKRGEMVKLGFKKGMFGKFLFFSCNLLKSCFRYGIVAESVNYLVYVLIVFIQLAGILL